MTARQRIENLTTSWISYLMVAAFATLVLNGLGFFSLLITACSMVVNVLIVVLIGRKLAAGSSMMRTFLLVVATFGGILGALGTAKLGWVLLHGFSFKLLVLTLLVGSHTVMNYRSLKVLLHRSVKAHCS